MKGGFLGASDSTSRGKNKSSVATSLNLCNENNEIAINNERFDNTDNQLCEQPFHWPKGFLKKTFRSVSQGYPKYWLVLLSP